jgi:hypothetical protein
MRSREYSRAKEILTVYRIEYYATVNGKRRFFVSQIRALSWTEATFLLMQDVRQRGAAFDEHVRRFDLGRDRSWLKGRAAAKAEVFETREYDREIYMRVQKKQGILC